MLVLGRNTNQSIIIDGGRIEVTIIEMGNDWCRIRVCCDKSIPVHRKEHLEKLLQTGKSIATENEFGTDGSLVLRRNIGQSIDIEDGRIVIFVVDVRDGYARLGFECHRSIPVYRKELWDQSHPEAKRKLA